MEIFEWIFDKAVDIIMWLLGIIWSVLQWGFENWKVSIVIIVILAIIGSILGKIQERKEMQELAEKIEERRKRFYTCDSCGKEEAIIKGDTEEIDRYPAYKEVEERTARGGYKTKQVRITKVKEKTHYHCKFCGAGFTTTDERELG